MDVPRWNKSLRTAPVGCEPCRVRVWVLRKSVGSRSCPSFNRLFPLSIHVRRRVVPLNNRTNSSFLPLLLGYVGARWTRSCTFVASHWNPRKRLNASGVVLVVISRAKAGRSRCTNGAEEGGDTVGESFMPAPGESRCCHRRSSLVLRDHDHVILAG